MQDPPRGGYYPANGMAGTMLQPRQYQYSATNPWQREEKEKVRWIIKNPLNYNVSIFSTVNSSSNSCNAGDNDSCSVGDSVDSGDCW